MNWFFTEDSIYDFKFVGGHYFNLTSIKTKIYCNRVLRFGFYFTKNFTTVSGY